MGDQFFKIVQLDRGVLKGVCQLHQRDPARRDPAASDQVWAAEEIALEQIGAGRDRELEVIGRLDLVRRERQLVRLELEGAPGQLASTQFAHVELDDVHDPEQCVELGGVNSNSGQR